MNGRADATTRVEDAWTVDYVASQSRIGTKRAIQWTIGKPRDFAVREFRTAVERRALTDMLYQKQEAVERRRRFLTTEKKLRCRCRGYAYDHLLREFVRRYDALRKQQRLGLISARDGLILRRLEKDFVTIAEMMPLAAVSNWKK